MKNKLLFFLVVSLLISSMGIAGASFVIQDNSYSLQKEILIEKNKIVTDAHNILEEKFVDVLGELDTRAAIMADGFVGDENMQVHLLRAIATAEKEGIIKEGDYIVAWKKNNKDNLIYLGLSNPEINNYRLIVVEMLVRDNNKVLDVFYR